MLSPCVALDIGGCGLGNIASELVNLGVSSRPALLVEYSPLFVGPNRLGQ